MSADTKNKPQPTKPNEQPKPRPEDDASRGGVNKDGVQERAPLN